jgi:hypothetical protein
MNFKGVNISTYELSIKLRILNVHVLYMYIITWVPINLYTNAQFAILFALHCDETYRHEVEQPVILQDYNWIRQGT